MEASLFQRLLDHWYDPLYRFAFSLSRNRESALDLTQQTFACWAEKGQALRDSSKAKSWLFTVLYREFLKSERHRRREPTADDADYFDRVEAVAKPPSDTIDSRTAMQALQAVDEVFRVPLTLFYLENNSYREIAEILGVPIGTVMSRIARGKEQLRKILKVNEVRPFKVIDGQKPGRRNIS